MATVTGLTAARTLAIENASIVSGAVNAQGNLILTKKDGSTVNAGPVAGVAGAAASITIGTTTLGTVGGAASVSNSGTSSAAVLNFVIPPGATGATGPAGPAGPAGTGTGGTGTGTSFLESQFPVTLGVALSDESSIITTGTKAKFRAPFSFTLTGVRISASTADATNIVTVDVLNGASTTIFTTKPTLDATEKTSLTAATPHTLLITSVSDDEELTFNATVTGTSSALRGLKVWLLGYRVIQSIAGAAPSQVLIASATARVLSVDLIWLVPVAGGGNITSYLVEYKLSSAATWTSISTTALTYTVTGLTPSVPYQFRVSAINAGGTGTASTVQTITPNPVSVPSAPTISSTTINSGTSITVNWTAPASNGSNIQTYFVEWGSTAISPFSYTGSATVASPNLSYTMAALSPSTTYQIKVSATNGLGAGPSSAAATASTWSIPGVPTAGTSPAAISGQVTINWVTPVLNGGTPVTAYLVNYRPTASTGAFTSVVINAPTTQAVISGLTNNTPYDFRVYARNIVGDSATFLLVQATPTTGGGTFAITSTAANTKYLATPGGQTASVSRAGTNATVASLSTFTSKVGWAQETGNANGYVAYEAFIDFPISVSGTTVNSVTLSAILSGSNLYQQNANSVTIELFAYAYGTTVEAADWAGPTQLTALGTTPLASLPVDETTDPTTNLPIYFDLSGTAGSNLKAAIAANLGGNLRLIVVTNKLRQNTFPPATNFPDETVQFSRSSWTLTVTMGA